MRNQQNKETKLRVLHHYIPKSIHQKRFIITNTEGTHYIPFDDMIYILADGNYTRVKTVEKTILVSKTLKKIQNQLPADKFIRIHHSHLINIDHLRLRTRETVEMSNGDRLRISRGNKDKLRV